MKENLERELRNDLELIRNYVGVLIIMCAVLWVTLFSVLAVHDYYVFAGLIFIVPAIIFHQTITTLGEKLL